MELTIRVRCIDFPSPTCDPRFSAFFLGVQCDEEVIDTKAVGEEPLEFEVHFRVAERSNGETNFLGPYAKGTVTERFFYLSWIAVAAGGRHERVGRMKVHLNHLKWNDVEQAVAGEKRLIVELPLTDKKGRPRCASIRDGEARWVVA